MNNQFSSIIFKSILFSTNLQHHLCHISGFPVCVDIILGSLFYFTTVLLIFLHATTILLMQLCSKSCCQGKCAPSRSFLHTNFQDHLKQSRPRAATFLYTLEFLEFLISLLVFCLQSSFRHQQQLWELLKNEQGGMCTFWKNKQRQKVRVKV